MKIEEIEADFEAKIILTPGKTFQLNGETYMILEIDREHKKMKIQEYYTFQEERMKKE